MRRQFVALFAFALASVPVLLSPGQAVADSGAHLEKMFDQASQNSAAGHLSKADRKFLSEHPELSLGIIDPALTTTREETKFTPAGSKTSRVVDPQEVQSAVGCFSTNRYQNYFSTAKVKVWEYHTRASWCNKLIISGSSARYEISGTPTVSSFFEDVNFCWDVKTATNYVDSYWSKSYRAQYATVRQGKITYLCGLILNVYPKNTVYLNANGTNSASFSR